MCPRCGPNTFIDLVTGTCDRCGHPIMVTVQRDADCDHPKVLNGVCVRCRRHVLVPLRRIGE